MTLRDVEAGEELFWDYAFKADTDATPDPVWRALQDLDQAL